MSLASRLTAAEPLSRRELVELFDTRIFLGCYFFWAAPAVQHLSSARLLYHWLARRLREVGKDSGQF